MRAVLFLALGWLAVAPAASAAPLDFAQLDRTVCSHPARGDPVRDRAEVEAATRELDARHKAELAALDDHDEAGFDAAEQAYLAARAELLQSLAAHGNAHAVFRLSYILLFTRAAFADAGEGMRLQSCAAEMGDPGAALEMFKLYWHDRTGVSVEAVQQRRAIALGWIDRALAAGNPEGFAYLATYLSAGFHLYPRSPDLGRRLALLCVETGGYACRRWLSPDAGAVLPPPRRSLSELMPEWRAIRAEILANDCPTVRCNSVVACRWD
jgi:hypothetical protein